MLQQATIRCETCGKIWPAPQPEDVYHEHPSVIHALATEHDRWRLA